jgi:hypothetical protein
MICKSCWLKLERKPIEIALKRKLTISPKNEKYFQNRFQITKLLQKSNITIRCFRPRLKNC